MILTLYYMAATWMQSWRLSSMRRNILSILGRNGSLVLYKDPEPAELEGGEGQGEGPTGISSAACSNRREATVGDLVWFTEDKRCCSVFPQQRLDVSRWIGFPGGQSFFPIEAGGSARASVSEAGRLQLLLEADYQRASSVRDSGYCRLEQFGVLKAWKAGGFFRLLMESDLEHFSKLGISFMRSRLSIDDGMELVRIQTVATEGEPCVLLNADSIPVARTSTVEDGSTVQEDNVMEATGPLTSAADALGRSAGQQMSPQQWLSHVELLRSFSDAAERVGRAEGARGPVGVGPSPAMLAAPGSLSSEESFHSAASARPAVSVPARLPEEQSVSPRESKSSDSFCSLGSASTLSVASHSGESTLQSPGDGDAEGAGPGRPVRTRGAAVRPPDVLVFSESSVMLGDTLAALSATLRRNEYCLYPLSQSQLLGELWKDHARLLVVCGSVPGPVAPVLVSHLLSGGRLLCLCSDLLGVLLPTFRTAEVRERELACFSYGRWRARLLHHVFCYHASPAHARFSRDDHRAGDAVRLPSVVEVRDGAGTPHALEVSVLGVEETWHSPSLLLACARSSGGQAVFSQVHLEVDPGQYEGEGDQLQALRESDRARLEILQDLLSSQLGLKCADLSAPPPEFTPAFFLGRHELKLEFLAATRGRMRGDTLKLPRLGLQFCEKGAEPSRASASHLPVLVHACPDRFSTVEYFENLKTRALGRLLLFSELMTSTMDVFDGPPLHHGLAVVALQQVSGTGRGSNVWLSPEGCAMFTLQLHVPGDSFLGRHAPFLQHVVGLAVVSGVCSQPGILICI
ncbi:biotin--protein ligase isoform X2 [Bacillus rossius redtenbacheri]|uniref:biotin--protein ligase isoform X2 n=1 Tax=Bacillus rossius redtenbacheri TaxID=93214 RepID=UPI002FDD6DE1